MKYRVLCLAIGALLVACSSSGGPGGGDDGGGGGRDGGAARDGGVARDGGGFPLRDGGSAAVDGGSDDGGPDDGGSPSDGGPDVGQPCTVSACRGDQILVCGSNGFYGPGEDCAVSHSRCIDGQCGGCQAGARRCAGTTTIEECASDGLGYATVDTCQSGMTCNEGRCVTASGCGASSKSNQGCDYWAVDLPNADVAAQAGGVSPATAQWAVVISNTDSTQTASITITKAVGGTVSTVVTDTVPPRDLKVFPLPTLNADQCGVTLGCPNVDYKAYRVQSTIPVVAYQFNPLNNTAAAYSNDASLLLPTNALDAEYIVVTGDAQAGQDRSGSTANWGAFVSVVGVADMPTNVTVTVPSGVTFDTPQGAHVSGQTITASLAKYQVLTVLSKAASNELSFGLPVTGGGNLSGARVTASAKVAVFSGNTASVAPHGTAQKCCADHMEEQLFPVSSWGREYVAPRSYPRKQQSPVETDLWRITAAQNGTTLTYVANAESQLSGQPTTLNAGQSVEFSSRGDFIVSASAPILVTQFMTSSNQAFDLGPACSNGRTCTPPATPAGRPAADELCTNAYHALASCKAGGCGATGMCMPVGDPSMTLIPPIRQWRRDYVFLTPLDYNLDYAVIVAPAGATVTLDGTALTSSAFHTIGMLNGVTYIRARVVLTARGRHVLSATAPVGLIVGGYDQDVSYGYPGGLNLETSTTGN